MKLRTCSRRPGKGFGKSFRTAGSVSEHHFAETGLLESGGGGGGAKQVSTYPPTATADSTAAISLCMYIYQPLIVSRTTYPILILRAWASNGRNRDDDPAGVGGGGGVVRE